MRSTRSRTKADTKTEQNLTSPIHKLPDELVAHIFILGCPKPTIDTDRPEPGDMADDPLPFQVFVSSICRRWRRISLQSPTLWSFIFIMLPFKNLGMAKRYLPLMNAIVQRSGVVSLTFTIKHRSPLCLRDDAVWGLSTVQNLLTNLLARVTFLKFHTSTPEGDTSQFPVFPITRDRYPHLRHLSILVGWGAFSAIIPGDGLLNLETLAYADWRQGRELSLIAGSNPRRLAYASKQIDDAALTAISHLTRLEELDILTHLWTASQPYSSAGVKCLIIQQPMDRAHPPAPLGNLPVLTHLVVNNPLYGLVWFAPELPAVTPAPPAFPALKTIAFQEPAHLGREGQVSFDTIESLVTRAPNLVALELWDANAFAALDCLCDGDTSRSPDGVILSDLHLHLFRLVISRRHSEDLLHEIARTCEQLMERRSSFRVEWWVIQSPPGTIEGLDVRGLLAFAPAKVEKHICKSPKSISPSLREAADSL